MKKLNMIDLFVKSTSTFCHEVDEIIEIGYDLLISFWRDLWLFQHQILRTTTSPRALMFIFWYEYLSSADLYLDMNVYHPQIIVLLVFYFPVRYYYLALTYSVIEQLCIERCLQHLLPWKLSHGI